MKPNQKSNQRFVIRKSTVQRLNSNYQHQLKGGFTYPTLVQDITKIIDLTNTESLPPKCGSQQ